jgi:hypothetical protein
MYRPDLTESAPVLLESVNKAGVSNWVLNDSLLLKVPKAFGSEDLGADFIHSDVLLVIILPAKEQQYLGIDIKTGKKLWDFNVRLYLANTFNAGK